VIRIKHLANLITATRIVCAAILPFAPAFSPLFWCLYAYGGISDLADGLIARALKQQSDFGAKLDSVADAMFFLAVMIAFLSAIAFPIWVWMGAAAILCLRAAAYFIGYQKYHTFSALHTYANKATGGLLLGAPVLCANLGAVATGVILCIVAAFSALEELLITVLSKDLNRDRKSIFLRENPRNNTPATTG
jgi:CDP-diacylglycerol--glycerol-3-phosphate 3-phosphatidyltransferase